MSSASLVVIAAQVGPVLVPRLSKADIEIAKLFSKTQGTVQSQNSVSVQLFQQSYIPKYFINSQLIAALMLIQ